jgi:hypothetical protein
MIPIINLHDATVKCHMLDEMVDFLTNKDKVSVIRNYQKWLISNMANEAGTDTVAQNNFFVTYSRLVLKLRKAGIAVR